jgi:hypothetical protein
VYEYFNDLMLEESRYEQHLTVYEEHLTEYEYFNPPDARRMLV